MATKNTTVKILGIPFVIIITFVLSLMAVIHFYPDTDWGRSLLVAVVWWSGGSIILGISLWAFDGKLLKAIKQLTK